MHRAHVKVLLACCVGLALCSLILLTGPQPLEASVPQGKPRVVLGGLERAMVANRVDAFGVLLPRQTLQLTTQVPGEITWVSEQLEAGDQVAQGDLLFQIDQRDYLIAVSSAEARYAQAQANIVLEEGRAEIAQLEWATWQRNQSEAESANPLALREPQRAEAVARRKAVLADLERAKLALERTEVRAPWPASVVHANAIVGQLLSVGEVTATLFPLDFAVVELQVPMQTLRLFDAGIKQILLRPIHDPNAPTVVGTFDSVVRNLTEDTRLATVRVRVDEPLNHSGWAYGMHLQANIEAQQQRHVALVPANLIISGNLIWVYREGRAHRHRLYPIENQGGMVAVEDNFASADALIIERPIGLFDGAEVASTDSAAAEMAVTEKGAAGS